MRWHCACGSQLAKERIDLAGMCDLCGLLRVLRICSVALHDSHLLLEQLLLLLHGGE